MAHHGHLDGLNAQASGLMRHGSLAAASLSSHSHVDSVGALERLENKLAMQTAEVEKLIRENQRLASSHVVLRQDIVDTEKEMQMIRTHLGEVQTETDMQIRELLERIRLMEADILSGDAVKQELHQVHMEAKRLIAERQMLNLDIDNVTKEQQKLSAASDNKSLPELLAELDGLRKEHLSLRSQFEFEKNTNLKQVEQMRTMEMNLMTMNKEADKLRAEVANAGRQAQAAQAAGAHMTQHGTAQATAVPASANPYASAYANYPTAYQQGPQPAAYQQGTQAGAYAYTTAYDATAAYQMHAAHPNTYAGYSGYPVAGYSQSAVPSYHAAYTVPPHPTSSAAPPTDVASLYGAVGSAGYPTGQVQASSGTANAGQAPPPPPPPAAPYPGAYDPSRGAQR